MACRLDRAKPYGTVSGDPEGRCFHQDGIYFDCDGNEHEHGAQRPPGKPAKHGKLPEPAPSPDLVDDQIKAQVNA